MQRSWVSLQETGELDGLELYDRQAGSVTVVYMRSSSHFLCTRQYVQSTFEAEQRIVAGSAQSKSRNNDAVDSDGFG